MEDKKNDLVKLGGLWMNEKSGMNYLSGYLGSAKLLIFSNKYHSKDTDPKYIMYVAPGKKKEEKAGF